MTIAIHSVHFHLSADLQEFIKRKVNKLKKLDNKIISTDVFLKLSKPESYSNKIIEIKVKYPGSEFFAKRKSDTFESSIIQVLQALRKQILKNKEKKQSFTRLKQFSKKIRFIVYVDLKNFNTFAAPLQGLVLCEYQGRVIADIAQLARAADL